MQVFYQTSSAKHRPQHFFPTSKVQAVVAYHTTTFFVLRSFLTKISTHVLHTHRHQSQKVQAHRARTFWVRMSSQ